MGLKRREKNTGLNGDFAADGRVDILIPSLMLEPHAADQVPVVGQRYHRRAHRGHRADQPLDAARPVQQRVIRVAVQMCEQRLRHYGSPRMVSEKRWWRVVGGGGDDSPLRRLKRASSGRREGSGQGRKCRFAQRAQRDAKDAKGAEMTHLGIRKVRWVTPSPLGIRGEDTQRGAKEDRGL